jgi:hypothetical protein
MTGSRESWQVMPPPPDSVIAGALADVRSGAEGQGLEGDPYADW